ncbi:hypothetical protein CPPEL_10560 [Corynebacterium pseudopelargi]|uniref:Uncharacterized protein n=2 Tax=Corynebacterium TaxID=1716 RepID=A0A3G6IWN8_9CORY|nr:hypothetical protein CPPEL_10560 [Corynebacterium pseudopelargi]QAU53328.1 hypothetical protein CPELA_10395 [Corynebacterium pelargi]
MEVGPAPFPGYFDQDAAQFAVAIVKVILGSIGQIHGVM